ncbi:unnamed protein product [Kuraishia capsulata CBS 1993]|uniref:TATA-binding protein-associated factor mot1 n=1 Tax=Kuraishia capsulata CBS 1993 TaxID=1382522 RepID=W6MLA7_9ASCO|nr:uncharacterized protein KUCA_T00001537001 [Kuraishia capsulata CBS 1993]CDK25567.1 unnamed protein product [Kuraishia capsulata CBS 1993]
MSSLLDTGSSAFIRNTAADQLADLAKQHPEECLNLLTRVYPFLKSKKWETRVSAAKAFGGIVNHADQWDPNSGQAKDEETDVKEEAKDGLVPVKLEETVAELKDMIKDQDGHLVSFDEWNLVDVIQSGRRLLATAVNDYNGKLEDQGMPDSKKRKTDLSSRLGLFDVSPEPQVDSDTPEVKSEIKSEVKPEIDQPATQAQSARMRAMAKRKARASAKGGLNKAKAIDLSESSVSRRLVEDGTIKDEDSKQDLALVADVDITDQADGSKIVVEHKVPEISPILSKHSNVTGWVWPFQGVFELMVKDLFNDVWEIRHGATMGLRELLKKHATGAGRVRGQSKSDNDIRNTRTLEDLSVRLLTLFAIDRFGDYVSDTVIAPVRENAAQTLAALLIHLPDDTVIKTFNALTQLVLQNPVELGLVVPCWEAKHGGMLGLRYFVSVRTDTLFAHSELLDKTIQMVLHGLTESDDDVQSVAASTLIPIAKDFVRLKLDSVFEIVNAIWADLSGLKDDLSASIGSVMDLLAKLCSHEEVLAKMKRDSEVDETRNFKHLIPRLYPFLRHSITNVRKAVLRTLQAFLSIQDDGVKGWVDGKILRLLFQNLLVEQNVDVLNLSKEVYNSLVDEINKKDTHSSMDVIFKDHASPLLSLVLTPIGVARHNFAMNSSLILRPSGTTLSLPTDSIDGNGEFKRGRKRKTPPATNGAVPVEKGIPETEYDMRVNIDAPMYNGDVTLVGVDVFIRTRLAAADAYGRTLASFTYLENLKPIFNDIMCALNDVFGTSRLFAGLILEKYGRGLIDAGKVQEPYVVDTFLPFLNSILASPEDLPAFRELTPILKSLRMQCLQLFSLLTEQCKVSFHKLPQLAVVVQGELEAGPDAFDIKMAEKVVEEIYPKILKNLSPMVRMSHITALEDAKHRIVFAIEEAKSSRGERSNAILAAHASASVVLGGLPKKLNPVIRSLMESIKMEESDLLQKRSAESVDHLIYQLIKSGKQGASDKMIKNLCGFICVDTSEVPEFVPNRSFVDIVLSLRKEEAKTDAVDIARHEKEVHSAKIKTRGAKFALNGLLEMYQEKLFIEIPKLKGLMLESLSLVKSSSGEGKIAIEDLQGQSIIDALGLIRALTPNLHESLFQEVFDRLDSVLECLKSDFSVFRYSAAKCFATLCATVPTLGFPFLVEKVLTMLNNAGVLRERQGAIECIYHLSGTMGAEILPYVVFLIVPVLGRMSDSNNDVRLLATTTFASIIKLVPLEAGIPDPPGMPKQLLEGRDREREFIQQMMDPSKIKPFALPVSIKATLRKYQQEGVNWLAFLNKYHLHGILCDDMGLGKTLQTICIVSSDHHMRAEVHAKTGSSDSRKLPSLVICPPSLTGHWEQEIQQYAPFMSVLVYAGGPSVRSALRSQLGDVDVVVTSYDVARNDAEHLSSQDYNYCVLDEGHIIKNASTKLTKSVKRIVAEHRLILSGTPIQNNVLELWSLFDFLMPGFLGTEKVFQEKFAKPIAASRNGKTSSKEQEAGALALESLHKQVLPFMLRRLKEDVLSDLPPKIIQDYYCDLSDLQRQLYRDFAKKQKDTVATDLQKNTEEPEAQKEGKQHIFQALQYMRKLCNHPALVLSPKHPQYDDVMKYLAASNMGIRDIRHAPKLMSLQILLKECGIGATEPQLDSRKQMVPSEGVISQHRALIFCQLKDMLDMVENDLLRKYMPSVTYLRLDGGTDPRQRQNIVRKFNNDPSIDVLLLTTKVGGLGLNLTGADTVIFVEHDWNPMNDLQAMDRAHRIGQKKVVNVYRLITKNTLEEKIMGLQKFKMNIASTIVNQQNAGLASMDTGQLLDLFDVDDKGGSASAIDPGEYANKNDAGSDKQKPDLPDEVGLGKNATAAMGELSELWDESQYEEEYNLDSFIKALK